MNYAAHAREGGSEPPERIVVFMKPSHTLAGPDDDFPASRGAQKLDWEVELALVVGRRAWNLGPDDDARGVIAGYAVANDISERAWQLEESGGQWSKGKSGPGFLPLGPVLVPTADLDPSDLRLRSWVNGEPRQDSTTADLIFDIDTIVRDLSTYTVLEPGDVILTGTPEGVALSGRFPYLGVGDVMEIDIEAWGDSVRSSSQTGRCDERSALRRPRGRGHRRHVGDRRRVRRPAAGTRADVAVIDRDVSAGASPALCLEADVSDVAAVGPPSPRSSRGGAGSTSS
nr:fumarylacetoacetate hydrolase family protein [Tessaracoccus coleopterorum]